ncbi:MAG: aldehyde reductase [Bacteroidales bacterium]|nr:aldehyde reductase [Bacteroidales bacterium]MBN2756136.1 aldehyde reductase [Bacteroidales bacterium]
MKKNVMITGATGYIGSWVAKKLLEKNYNLRITVRDAKNKSKVQHLIDIAEKNGSKIELFEADLMKEGSFDEAAKGCEIVVHVASPFFLNVKDAKKDLIQPALQGTKNVLSAATKSGTVKRVVLTSSVAAVHGDNIDMKIKGLTEFTEENFNDSSSETHQPYSYSKVLAEKEAWKIAENQNQWDLVVINPSFVLGPSLTNLSASESLTFMKDMLTGKFQMGAPALFFGFVDVRDVAEAHVLAIENQTAEGRNITSERVMSVMDLAEIIRNKYGKKYKLPVMKSPKFMLYMIGWMFGLSTKFVKRNIGYPIKLNNRKSIEKLGLKYTEMQKTVIDMVEQMEEQKVI